MKSFDVSLAAALLAGYLAYILAISSSFNLLQLTRSIYTPATILLLTIIGGSFTIGLGYISILLIGGGCSLGVANFVATITRSKHVVEYVKRASKNKWQRLLEYTYLIYAAGMVFLLLVAIAWDLHNADGPHAGIFYPFLNATNIFLTRTATVSPIRFSIDNLPLLFILTGLAGIAPSLTLPYFRNFKITSVNSGNFHTNLLLTVVGLLAGLSVTLTLVGLIYKVLWASAGKTIPSYHFVLLVMMGFSVHYAAGTYLGQDRTEHMLVKRLERQSAKSRIFFGTVDVKPGLSATLRAQGELRVDQAPTDPRIAQEK